MLIHGLEPPLHCQQTAVRTHAAHDGAGAAFGVPWTPWTVVLVSPLVSLSFSSCFFNLLNVQKGFASHCCYPSTINFCRSAAMAAEEGMSPMLELCMIYELHPDIGP
jgi:hypothetical protein